MLRCVRGVVSRGAACAVGVPRRAAAVASAAEPKKTALYDLHVALDGKVVDFAGYALPVQYGGLSALQSHKHTRVAASIFDVSHMLQMRVDGADAVAFVESLVPVLVSGKPLKTKYSVICNENGGIIDDLMVTRYDDHVYVVSNAARRVPDLAHFRQHLAAWKARGKDVNLHEIEEHSLIALQGPQSQAALQPLCKADLNGLYFLDAALTQVCGVPVRLSRCGYTGEDGFELAVEHKSVRMVTEALLGSKAAHVEMAGLAARDSLRLESGLCLYGHDLFDTKTPVESSIEFAMSKARLQRGDFVGAAPILKQLRDGVTERRVGLSGMKAPVREGMQVFAADAPADGTAKPVGAVTSGTFGPSTNTMIAMAYVPASMSALGSRVSVQRGSKMLDATVVAMPFLPTKYRRAPPAASS